MGLVVMPVNLVLVLLLLAVSVPCLAQVTVPDTPAERKFAAWLELFDRGDRAAYQEFLEKNYPSHHQPADQAIASFVEPCGIQSAALRFLEFRAMTDDPLASR